jgi:hypothetical protein
VRNAIYHLTCAKDANGKARSACDKDVSDVTFARRTKVCLTRHSLRDCGLDMHPLRHDSFDLLSATKPMIDDRHVGALDTFFHLFKYLCHLS